MADKKNGTGKARKKSNKVEARPGPVLLTDISPTAWEHPADRAALNALRKIPGLDSVVRKIVGLFGEKPIRLSLQANAVKVGPKQYPWIHERLLKVCETFDVDDVPGLFITQTPTVNAGALGFDKPFIILNSSTIEMLTPDQVESVLAHEVAHIESGHAVYRTVLAVLRRLAAVRYPIAGIATAPIRLALAEWSRKSELSCDRASLLAVQNPTIVMSSLMRVAGGSRGEELDLDEFVAQSESYRGEGDTLDRVFKFFAAMETTHPFAVVRVAELRDWIDSGEYEQILAGDYRTRANESEQPYSEDLGEAAGTYASKARGVYEGVGSTIGNVTNRVSEAWKAGA